MIYYPNTKKRIEALAKELYDVSSRRLTLLRELREIESTLANVVFEYSLIPGECPNPKEVAETQELLKLLKSLK